MMWSLSDSFSSAPSRFTDWAEDAFFEAPVAYIPPAPRDDGERLARLRLIRSRRVGPATYLRLMAEHGAAQTALLALPDIARAAGVEGYTPAPNPWRWPNSRPRNAPGRGCSALVMLTTRQPSPKSRMRRPSFGERTGRVAFSPHAGGGGHAQRLGAWHADGAAALPPIWGRRASWWSRALRAGSMRWPIARRWRPGPSR